MTYTYLAEVKEEPLSLAPPPSSASGTVSTGKRISSGYTLLASPFVIGYGIQFIKAKSIYQFHPYLISSKNNPCLLPCTFPMASWRSTDGFTLYLLSWQRIRIASWHKHLRLANNILWKSMLLCFIFSSSRILRQSSYPKVDRNQIPSIYGNGQNHDEEWKWRHLKCPQAFGISIILHISSTGQRSGHSRGGGGGRNSALGYMPEISWTASPWARGFASAAT